MLSSDELLALMRDVEAEDPIDYADLPYDEEALRRLVCTQVCEISEQAQVLDASARERVLLAVAAKLVLENMVLNLRLLKSEDRPECSEEWFARWRGKT